MVSDKVSKLVIGHEQEIVGLSNPQPDGSVKVDDVEVVGAVTECGKLADDEFSIPEEFPGSVWVSKEYRLFCHFKGKKPVTVHVDGFRRA